MRVLIVANGEIGLGEHIPQASRSADLVIAVDGGWLHCQDLGIQVDILIGDLDSLPDTLLQNLQQTDIRLLSFPAEKDEIDLELALLHALEEGAHRITVLGGLGKRLDMTMANLSLMLHPRLEGLAVEFWHQGQRVWLIRPPGDEITGEAGDTLSLLPFGGDANGIHTHNLAYPLDGDSLLQGPAQGVSNVLTARQARVSLENGALLAVWTPGRA